MKFNPSPVRFLSASLLPAVVFLCWAQLASAKSDSWPEFRGPTGQGTSTATNVPSSWNSSDHVAWKLPVPGTGWSSPILDQGRLYLTTAVSESDGSNVSLRVLAISADTGKVDWDIEAIRPDAGATKSIHRKNSLASPTPVSRDGLIYAHFGHMGTVCLKASDGSLVWKQTDNKYSPIHGTGCSPILAGGLLIFSCDGASNPYLLALDTKTGAIKWKTPRNTPAKKSFSFCTPLVIENDGEQQIISPCSGFVGGYRLSDGQELWRLRYGEGYSVVPRPILAHGLLFVSSGFDTPIVHAFRPAKAKGDITDTHLAWTARKGAPNTPSMLVVGNELYYVSDSGIATCADAKTGAVHWSERLGGDFSASPVLAENRLYFVNESGTTFVLKPGKTFDLLAKNELNEKSLASPAVADNALFIRTESTLWRIKP